MSFKPLGKRVLVQLPEEKKQTDSGIFLPESSQKDAPIQAKVVAVGVDIKDIKVDDEVVYTKYSGTDLNLDGIDYLILEDKDILGLIK